MVRIVKRQLPAPLPRTHNYINRDIPRPLRIPTSLSAVRVSPCAHTGPAKSVFACLFARWLAYEQQKVYVSSNNDTGAVNSHEDHAQCSTRFIIYRLATTPLAPRVKRTLLVYPEAIMRDFERIFIDPFSVCMVLLIRFNLYFSSY